MSLFMMKTENIQICESLCWNRDRRDDGGRYTHDMNCPVGKEEEKQQNERTEDTSSGNKGQS
jgi:hypothetical protein